jgi:hypothetical protein
VAPPRVWKPRGAPAAASHLEPVWISPFGRAPAGAALGAALGALPNRPFVCSFPTLALPWPGGP